MNIQPYLTNNFKDLYQIVSLPDAKVNYRAQNDFGRVILELLFAKAVSGISQRFSNRSKVSG